MLYSLALRLQLNKTNVKVFELVPPGVNHQSSE